MKLFNRLFRKKYYVPEVDFSECLISDIDYVEVYLDDNDKPRVYKNIRDAGWENNMFMIETLTEKTYIHPYVISEIVIRFNIPEVLIGDEITGD